MGVLVLTPGFYGRDGVSCLSREMVRALRTRLCDEEVEVWSLNEDERILPLGDMDPGFRGAGRSRVRFVAWCAARAMGNCVGLTVLVLHAHLSPVSLLLQARGARVYHVLHGIEVWKKLSYLQRKAFAAAERLLAVSEHSAARFRARNADFESITVCHPGLPEEAEEGPLLREVCSFALVVGRMASSERYKGHDVLLEMWPGILKEVSTARLVIVGDGDDRPRLMKKASALNLDRVVSFRGNVSDEELRRLYLECGFFVMPSKDEGFGLVFLEAMRASKPCIGAVGSASEIIVDGKTGFVAESSEAVMSAVIRLSREQALRERMGTEGAARFGQFFSERCFRDRFLSTLSVG